MFTIKQMLVGNPTKIGGSRLMSNITKPVGRPRLRSKITKPVGRSRLRRKITKPVDNASVQLDRIEQKNADILYTVGWVKNMTIVLFVFAIVKH